MAENDTLKYLINNDGFVAMDNGFNRILNVDMTSSDVTLTQTQFTRNVTFRCVNNTVARTLTVPSTVGSSPTVTVNRFFIVVNDGTEEVTISGGVGTDEVVAAGSAAMVVADGTNIILVSRVSAVVEYRDEGVAEISSPEFIDFVGAGVSAESGGGGLTVTVSLPTVEDSGVSVTTDTSTINFVGNYVEVTDDGGVAEVAIGGLTVQEEGTPVATDPEFINFVGTNVTATLNGTGIDVEITGAGGGVSTQTEITGTTYTTLEADFAGNVVRRINDASGCTITVAAGLTNNEPCTFIQTGAGQITFAPDTGVTIESADGHLLTRVQFSSATLVPDKDTADLYYLIGDITT